MADRESPSQPIERNVDFLIRMYTEQIMRIEERLSALRNEVSVNTVKITEVNKLVTLHTAYQKEAVDKASTELRERLHAMNEFRDQLREQTAQMLSRSEYIVQHDAALRRINLTETLMANAQGRFWALSLLATIGGGLLGILGALLIRLMGGGSGH